MSVILSVTLDASEVEQLDKFCALASRTREEAIRVWLHTLGKDEVSNSENRVLAMLKKMRPNAVRAKHLTAWLDSVMSRSAIYRELDSLTRSGKIEKAEVHKPGQRRHTVYCMKEVVQEKM